jgi:hypothetical protein
MSEPMVPIMLTAAELKLVTNTLETYISDFGHENHELIEQARAVMAKLAAAPNANGSRQTVG